MKWLLLIMAVGGVLPFVLWLRGNLHHAPTLFVAMGLLPFLMSAVPALDMALLAWPTWVGHTHGLEISLIDLLALAILFALPPTRSTTPFRMVFGIYFLAVLLSLYQARVPTAASFYVWQLARMYLVYAVVARACTDDRLLDALLQGMALGLLLQAAVVVWQRYGLGIVQTQGTFVHQNTLGMVSHMVVLPHFAVLLAGLRGWQPIATPLAGAIIAVLTASRAALGLSTIGFAIVYLISTLRRWTARKALIAVGAMAGAVILVPLVMTSFERRFAAAPLSQDYDEREAFKRAAGMMLADYPLGVGPNHYVVISKNEGYSERAGVIKQSRDSHVHNAYWLAAAETGYIGLVAFLLLLSGPLIVAFRAGWRNRGDPKGDLLLGIGAGLLIVYIHSFFEWILFTAQVQYLFFMSVGMVAGVAQQLAGREKKREKNVPAGRDTVTIGRPIGKSPAPVSSA